MRSRARGIQPRLLRRTKFRFGGHFELDPSQYELRLAGQPLRLRPIPFELLHLLIRRRGQLVSRDQIVMRVWGETALSINTDRNINETIKQIRKVLRDDVDQSRFIKTVFTRGYRFVAPVRVVKYAQVRAFFQ
jgi:eukaryotic-like serine/threonine-protein kinase